MKTPADKTIAFTFMSRPTTTPEVRWAVRLTFPPGSGPDTVLPMVVVDGNDQPIESATLELAGMKIPVRDGRAEMRYSDFIKGKHSVPLWLYRDGMQPVPGGLTFA